MKQLIFSIYLVFILLQTSFSQVQTRQLEFDKNTIIKDTVGNKVELNSAVSMINSGDWAAPPVFDERGDILYYRLVRLTKESKKAIEPIQKADIPTSNNNENFINKCPDFTVTDLNGKEYSSKELEGKVIVLNFWFNVCKPCIDELPKLNAVYQEYRNDTNVVFIAITFDKKEKVLSFLKKHKFDYPIVYNQSKTADIFKIKGYPTNIVINKKLEIYDRIMGGYSGIDNFLLKSIKDALSNKPAKACGYSDMVIVAPDSKFKDEKGNEIKYEKAMKMFNSNKYDVENKIDLNNVKYIQLKLKK